MGHLKLVGGAIIALVLASASTALAFRACQPKTSPAGSWPDPTNTSHFGTQKWKFNWKVDGEGLEVYNVRYMDKMVMKRGSLPFLPAHYPGDDKSLLACKGPPPPYPHGYPDQLFSGSLDAFCCFHAPTDICSGPDEGACRRYSGIIDTNTCPSGSVPCDGVCVGTQVDRMSPLEDGFGEEVSGSSDADVLLSATFKLGYYQFVQRWRFQDNGTIIPSLRAGAVHDCQLHSHQIYWRFNFEFVDVAQGAKPAEVVQQCDLGGCADMGSLVDGWSANLGCMCAVRQNPSDKTWWRISDNNAVPARAVIVQTNPKEGAAPVFCENTVPPGCHLGQGTQSDPNKCVCFFKDPISGVVDPDGCFNTHDFCALPALEPSEKLNTEHCNDNLLKQVDQLSNPACATFASGGDASFWYFGHIDNHNPCEHHPVCDPKPGLGAVAFGPTIRLVGAW